MNLWQPDWVALEVSGFDDDAPQRRQARTTSDQSNGRKLPRTIDRRVVRLSGFLRPSQCVGGKAFKGRLRVRTRRRRFPPPRAASRSHRAELKKPRWILAHDHVVFARTLFDKLGCPSAHERDAMLAKIGFDDDEKRRKLRKRHEGVIDDFRVIDMYDAAARHDIQVYQNREGNWVQKFRTGDEGLLFATAQFGRYREIERFLKEHLASEAAMRAALSRRAKS